MGLPAYLGQGLFSIYGLGNPVGITGLVAPTGFLFGAVYNAWNGNSELAAAGDSVMFKETDVVCRLAWENGIYTLVETEKIKLTEIPRS